MVTHSGLSVRWPSRGLYIVAAHWNGWETYYMHLAESSILPRVGANVNTDTVIGVSDSSGLAFGDHLHMGLRDQSISEEDISRMRGFCDPAPFLA